MNAVERIKEIFSQALEKPPGPEREAFLTEKCRGDSQLLSQVQSLLLADDRAGAFLGKTMPLPPSDFMIEPSGTMIGRYKLLQPTPRRYCLDSSLDYQGPDREAAPDRRTTTSRMKPRKLKSRVLICVGGIAMLVGAADPMEGSLVILAGCALVTLGTYFGNSGRGLLIQWQLIFILIAIGVGAVWGIGILGHAAHSVRWPWLVLPYPIGWVVGITNLGFRLVRSLRHRHVVA